jgi:hypothetical protein
MIVCNIRRCGALFFDILGRRLRAESGKMKAES